MSQARYRIPEIADHTRRLGRHVNHDPRSRNYKASLAPAIVDTDHAVAGLPLDQGAVGCCTASALCGALNSAPNYKGGAVLAESDALNLYTRETADEGYPWPQYDPGGDGLAVCKAAKELGMISSYTHTFNALDAVRALVLRPVIVGMNWYNTMDSPDGNGVVAISPDAVLRGGHEVVATAIDAERQLIGFWNSWGPNWGQGGRFWMSFATCERLLCEDGDVTVPLLA